MPKYVFDAINQVYAKKIYCIFHDIRSELVQNR